MTESHDGVISRAGLTVKKIGQKIGLSPADESHGIHQLSMSSTTLALGAGGVASTLARTSSARGTPQGTNKYSHVREKSTSSSQSAVLTKRTGNTDTRKSILHLTGVSTSVATPFHHVRIAEPPSSPPSTSSGLANDAGHAQEMNNAGQSAMNKPPRPHLLITTEKKAHSLHGEAARRGKNRVSEDVEIPLSDSPSEENSQPLSTDSQLRPALCLSREEIHSMFCLPRDFDATVPALRTFRKEKIPDLTGHITKEEKRSRFETAFSDVWKGRLNGHHGHRMVSFPGHYFARHIGLLVRFRSLLSLYENKRST